MKKKILFFLPLLLISFAFVSSAQGDFVQSIDSGLFSGTVYGIYTDNTNFYGLEFDAGVWKIVKTDMGLTTAEEIILENTGNSYSDITKIGDLFYLRLSGDTYVESFYQNGTFNRQILIQDDGANANSIASDENYILLENAGVVWVYFQNMTFEGGQWVLGYTGNSWTFPLIYDALEGLTIYNGFVYSISRYEDIGFMTTSYYLSGNIFLNGTYDQMWNYDKASDFALPPTGITNNGTYLDVITNDGTIYQYELDLNAQPPQPPQQNQVSGVGNTLSKDTLIKQEQLPTGEQTPVAKVSIFQMISGWFQNIWNWIKGLFK